MPWGWAATLTGSRYILICVNIYPLHRSGSKMYWLFGLITGKHSAQVSLILIFQVPDGTLTSDREEELSKTGTAVKACFILKLSTAGTLPIMVCWALYYSQMLILSASL